MTALYDSIGLNYAALRRSEPSIARAIGSALGGTNSVLNVGAGSGSYEPMNHAVIAVEISSTMINQRPPDAAPVVQGDAMALPFATDSFDASMAILTIHHWPDKAQGLAELRRVARQRVVMLTWDPSHRGFWLTDYFPEIIEMDLPIFPRIDAYEKALGAVTVFDVPVPHNCVDGFLGAYWRRPAAYLDARVRAAISAFPKLRDEESGVQRLDRDLKSGEWQRRYGEVLGLEELDLGYRLIVADL